MEVGDPVRVRKWSRTANDPQIGPQVIADRKWSPYWTANDPDQKIRNGMNRKLLYLNTNIFLALSKCPAAPQGLEWTKCPGQLEIFTEFPLKDYFKFLDDIWCFLRNVERLQKLCSFVRRRNNRACAYYEICICLTLRKFTLTSLSNSYKKLLSNQMRRCDVCLE